MTTIRPRSLLRMALSAIFAALGILALLSALGCASLHTAQATFVAAQAADLLTTEQGLASGRGVEANPLMATSPPVRLAAKVGVTTLVLWASHHVDHTGHPRAARVLLYSLSGVTFAVAAHNAQIGH